TSRLHFVRGRPGPGRGRSRREPGPRRRGHRRRHPRVPGLDAGGLGVASLEGMSTIAVLGGSGTFGARVCRDLARRGHRIVVTGRDLGRAFAVARTLEGGSHEALRAEATDPESCRRAVRGAAVVAVCAGPFSTL